jgi:hypothetical protein
VDQVVNFIGALSNHFRANETDLLKEIREVATFKKNDLKDRVIAAILAFRGTWSA